MSEELISPQVIDLLNFTVVHNRHRKALVKATGEQFNIFKTLNISRGEVTTHSPILAELLNPEGSHDQGAAFLRLFLEHFKGKPSLPEQSRQVIEKFDTKNATVITEYYLGPVTKDSGGRIDIVITDGHGEAIVIENKIGAGDQPNQMPRYREAFPRACLFYLTLEGSRPGNIDEAEFKSIQCNCIAYATDILRWLQDCLKEAVRLPGVRETITQYIHLIQELTNQSTNILMSKDLIDNILASPESLKAFHTLRNEESAVQSEIIRNLKDKLQKFAIDHHLTLEGTFLDLNRQNEGFYFSTPGLSQRNLNIGFAFDANNFSEFGFGFIKDKPTDACFVESQIIHAFKEAFQFPRSTSYWPAFAYWEDPYRNWRQEAFEKIQSGQFELELVAKLEKLLKIANQICPNDVIEHTEGA